MLIIPFRNTPLLEMQAQTSSAEKEKENGNVVMELKETKGQLLGTNKTKPSQLANNIHGVQVG